MEKKKNMRRTERGVLQYIGSADIKKMFTKKNSIIESLAIETTSDRSKIVKDLARHFKRQTEKLKPK